MYLLLGGCTEKVNEIGGVHMFASAATYRYEPAYSLLMQLGLF